MVRLDGWRIAIPRSLRTERAEVEVRERMGPKRKWYQANNKTRDGHRFTDGATEADRQDERQQSTKKPRISAINIGQVKGHQAVVGTCDVRNDRAATAELIDLLNAFADVLIIPPKGGGARGVSPNKESSRPSRTRDDASVVISGSTASAENRTSATQPSSEVEPPSALLSVEEMVREEAKALRTGQDKTQRFMSVNTSVKGVIMVCVMDPTLDVLLLVDALFAEIRETGKRRSRFLERVTPIQVTSFSEIESFKAAVQPIVFSALPPVAEGVPSLASGLAAEVVDCSREVPAIDGGDKSSGAAAVLEDPETAKEPSNSDNGAGGQAMQTTTGAAGKGEGRSEVNDHSSKKGVHASLGEPSDHGAPDGGAHCMQQAACPGRDEVVKIGGSGVEAEGGASTIITRDERWKFRVDVRKRNSALKRMALIEAVAESVGKGHSASMASPNVSVAQRF